MQSMVFTARDDDVVDVVRQNGQLRESAGQCSHRRAVAAVVGEEVGEVAWYGLHEQLAARRSEAQFVTNNAWSVLTLLAARGLLRPLGSLALGDGRASASTGVEGV